LRALVTITTMVVAREANRVNTLSIAVIVLSKILGPNPVRQIL
jgi:hypothetical protein